MPRKKLKKLKPKKKSLRGDGSKTNLAKFQRSVVGRGLKKAVRVAGSVLAPKATRSIAVNKGKAANQKRLQKKLRTANKKRISKSKKK